MPLGTSQEKSEKNEGYAGGVVAVGIVNGAWVLVVVPYLIYKKKELTSEKGGQLFWVVSMG